jgi:hypothetical protein
MISQKQIDKPFNQIYFDGLKNFFNYMFNHKDYMLCELGLIPPELNGIAMRFIKFDPNADSSYGTKKLSFINRNYLQDDVLFFMDDNVINFNCKKLNRKPYVRFDCEIMKKRDGGEPHFYCFTTPEMEVIKNGIGYVYKHTSPAVNNTIGPILDLCEQRSYEEICYCIHNRIPLYI